MLLGLCHVAWSQSCCFASVMLPCPHHAAYFSHAALAMSCCLPVSCCLVPIMYLSCYLAGVILLHHCHVAWLVSCCLALANVVLIHLFHTALSWPISCHFTSLILPCSDQCHVASPLSYCLALADVTSLHLFHTALPWPVSCCFTSFILPCPSRLPCLCRTAWPVSYGGALHESNTNATNHPICQLQLRYHGCPFSFSPYPQFAMRQSCLGLHAHLVSWILVLR